MTVFIKWLARPQSLGLKSEIVFLVGINAHTHRDEITHFVFLKMFLIVLI